MDLIPAVYAQLTAPAVLNTVALGFLLGAIGQGARAIVGLKKTSDEARAKGESFGERFRASELVVSLIIGGVAGSLASLPLIDAAEGLTKQTVLALIAAGYAGADFIEGFMRDASAKPAPNSQVSQPDAQSAPSDQDMSKLLRRSQP